MIPSAHSSTDEIVELYKCDLDVTLIERNLLLTVDEKTQELQRLLEFSDQLQRATHER